MDVKELIKFIEVNCPHAILLHGLDNCIVAIHIGLPNNTNVIYSKARILDKLVNTNKMSYTDALDFFNMNIAVFNFNASVRPYFVEDSIFNISLN